MFRATVTPAWEVVNAGVLLALLGSVVTVGYPVVAEEAALPVRSVPTSLLVSAVLDTGRLPAEVPRPAPR